MGWLPLILAAATTVTPVDALLLARDIGPPPHSGPTTIDMLRAAEDAVRGFWTLEAVRRHEVDIRETALRACGPEAECLGAALEGRGIGAVIYIIANWSQHPPVISVAVIDTTKRAVMATNFKDGYDVIASVEALVPRSLEQAGHRKGAELILNVVPANARVDLEPQAPGKVRNEFQRTIAPGHYEVRLSAEGYEPKSRQIDLAVGSRTRLDIRLTEYTSIYETWWFWTAVGVVAATATVTTLAVTGNFTKSVVEFR